MFTYLLTLFIYHSRTSSQPWGNARDNVQALQNARMHSGNASPLAKNQIYLRKCDLDVGRKATLRFADFVWQEEGKYPTRHIVMLLAAAAAGVAVPAA